MGYCPFACAGSRYRELYRDKRLGRQAWACERRRATAGLARSRTLRHGQEALRCGRPARGASGAGARMAWPLGVCRDKNGRIVTGGLPGCWVYRETGCDTVCSKAAIQPSIRHDTAQEARDVARRATTRSGPARDTTRQCARVRIDTAGDGATIRPSARHDKTLCAWPGCNMRNLDSLGVHPVHPTQF